MDLWILFSYPLLRTSTESFGLWVWGLGFQGYAGPRVLEILGFRIGGLKYGRSCFSVCWGCGVLEGKTGLVISRDEGQRPTGLGFCCQRFFRCRAASSRVSGSRLLLEKA